MESPTDGVWVQAKGAVALFLQTYKATVLLVPTVPFPW